MPTDLHPNESPGKTSLSPRYEPVSEYSDVLQWEYEQPLPSVVDPVKWYFTGFKGRVFNYLKSLFPILDWIHLYNLKWLWGDLVAGITVGVVLVPQSMSYARVAGYPVQYGLYSSFIGTILYCFFATSKDMSVGPVVVLSSEVYRITHKVLTDVPGLTERDAPLVGGVIALLCGSVLLGFGILRLGFILEYIPMPAVMGYMTGSAFTIATGQLPNLFGTQKLVNTRDASYLVVVNFLKHLPQANINAAFGVVSLFVLYFMKYMCSYLEKRDKKRRILWFYLGTLRVALVIIFTTLIAWGCHRIYGKTKISMIGHVPRGLKHVGVHPIDSRVAASIAPKIPIATVILVLEHIAVGKSFGRVNEYRINPNQELIAIGISNVFGYFFEAFPITGAFSRSALKSKCGVRTPLAGLFSGLCVLVAIYALTDAFRYISEAAMAAVIIHAVGDLVASYKTSLKFYKVSPVEFLIFFVDVLLCVFVQMEAGIYFSVAASLVNLLLKQTFPLGEFLGKVHFTQEVVNVPEEAESEKAFEITDVSHQNSVESVKKNMAQRLGNCKRKLAALTKCGRKGKNEEVPESRETLEYGKTSYNHVTAASQSEGSEESIEALENSVLPSGPGEPSKDLNVTSPRANYLMNKWWPLSHNGIHPDVKVVPPPPGIFVYRFRESLTYQNASWQSERIVEYIRTHTRRNLDISLYRNRKLGDRPWNESGPRKFVPPTEEDTRPILRAIIFDMSCSPNVDMTGAQVLWDCHQELSKYACGPVEFHFAGILSPWSRRALVNCGFGGTKLVQPPSTHRLIELAPARRPDVEAMGQVETGRVPITDTRNCYFHFDIPDLEFGS